MKLESALHAQVSAYLRVALRPPWWFSTIGHGGIKLPIRTAVALKARGLRPGMPDILVFGPRKVIGLELKSAKGRVSDEQRAVHFDMHECGFPVFVCRSVDDVESGLMMYAPLRATTFAHTRRAA